MASSLYITADSQQFLPHPPTAMKSIVKTFILSIILGMTGIAAIAQEAPLLTNISARKTTSLDGQVSGKPSSTPSKTAITTTACNPTTGDMPRIRHTRTIPSSRNMISRPTNSSLYPATGIHSAPNFITMRAPYGTANDLIMISSPTDVSFSISGLPTMRRSYGSTASDWEATSVALLRSVSILPTSLRMEQTVWS